MTAINPQAVRGPVTAVPVVAGKGVRFVQDVENNRVVAEADETVLWEGTASKNVAISLSESMFNFSAIKIVYHVPLTSRPVQDPIHLFEPISGMAYIPFHFAVYHASDNYPISDYYCECSCTSTSITPIASVNFWHQLATTTGGTDTSSTFFPCKIVGVNRIASA